jgi:hypothetical protein
MTRHVDRDLPKIVGSLLLLLPKLTIRFGIQAFRFKAQANKAARIFRNELTRQGLDTLTTQRLTESYLQTSDPFKLLRVLL